MSRRKQLFGSQDWLICLVIASPWLIGLAALGSRELSHLLPYADAAHPAKPDVFRAWVELLSFVGSFGLFVTAIIAGCITYSQLRDARAARLAAVYVEVNKTYNSDLMRQSRMEILRIRREFEASGAPGDLAAYLADRMMGWKITAVDCSAFGRFNACIRILNFWEDVGVLVDEDFMDPDVILNFHRAGLRLAHNQFRVYIERARQADEVEQRKMQPSYEPGSSIMRYDS